MKQNKLSLITLFSVSVLLLASTATELANSSTENAPNENKGLGQTIFDIPSLLDSLGYTEEQMKNVSSALLINQLKALDSNSHSDENGNTVITFSRPDGFNISDITLDINATNNTYSISGTKDFTPGKACIVVAVWDYPGSLYDFQYPGYVSYAYNDVWGYVTGYYSPYAFTQSLVNSDATYYNVYSYITWACIVYETVDVYLIGHGTYLYWGPPYYPAPWDFIGGYACYDSLSDWGVDTSKIYWEWDLRSFYDDSYDYSSLRLGVGGCCYGGYFANTFLNPGGAVSHSRCFMGGEDIVYTGYHYNFLDAWDYKWYGIGQNSYTAYSYAYDEAEDYIEDGVAYNFYGDSIYK